MGPGYESLKVHQQAVPAPKALVYLRYFVFLSIDEKARERGEICASVSVSNAEGPPVPIPNTEVKLCGADNTRWETAREDRSWPTLFLLSSVGSARVAYYKCENVGN